MKSLLKRYGLYLLRWQLSTPILAVCLIVFASIGKVWSTVLANLIGGLIFFWVDRFIFTDPCLGDIWGVAENVVCADCGKVDRGYRLVCSRGKKYDRRKDAEPEFRCHECSIAREKELKASGKL